MIRVRLWNSLANPSRAARRRRETMVPKSPVVVPFILPPLCGTFQYRGEKPIASVLLRSRPQIRSRFVRNMLLIGVCLIPYFLCADNPEIRVSGEELLNLPLILAF